MEEKTGKVKEIIPSGEWKNDNVRGNKPEIVFEDGDSGFYYCHPDYPNPPFKVGDTITYTKNENDKITIPKKRQESTYTADPNRENSIFKCNALNNAVTYWEKGSTEATPEGVCDTAEKFLTWLKK